MRKTYSVIAWIIAGGVVVQAASIAFAFGGIGRYVQDGGVIDKALVESRQATFTGDLGFPIHAIVGGMVIPLAAVALLIIAFFVKARGARKWAGIVLALVALQITLGTHRRHALPRPGPRCECAGRAPHRHLCGDADQAVRDGRCRETRRRCHRDLTWSGALPPASR